ncbi:hypothetical protein KDC22_10855 [Paenibacillus tritici]|uniref:hypothetical protein n=1 Tax=Paenibacillus tritici TaxID=1873425 RepID=UPI001BAD7608|nr:hypothetical protein [Paenibacillus tritici]QUL56924.1 hypothetical protein KDC22_10855 [Paenibacillus tritici]
MGEKPQPAGFSGDAEQEEGEGSAGGAGPGGAEMSRQIILPLAGYNLKLTLHYSWLLSAALLVAVPFFMEPSLMDRRQTAKLGELLISLIGLIVYPYLGLLEDGGIGEVLYAKRIRPHPVFLFRWLLTVLFIFLAVTALFTWVHGGGAEFELWPMIGGTVITAVAIGTAGTTAALLTGNISAGYIAGFAWYLLDFTTKGKLTGHFYLFGLLRSEWDHDKWLLAGLSLALALFCACWLPRRRLD